jgi:hypothetical protein
MKIMNNSIKNIKKKNKKKNNINNKKMKNFKDKLKNSINLSPSFKPYLKETYLKISSQLPSLRFSYEIPCSLSLNFQI